MANRPFDETIIMIPLINSTGFEWNKKLSKNLTVKELYDATKVPKKQKEQLTEIPIDKRLIDVFQLLRDTLGKPIKPTSAYRSPEWEDMKKRFGSRRIHTEAKALDMQGKGLVKLVSDAYDKKNDLYTELRALGVTSYGIYDTFVHLDVDHRKHDQTDRYWYKRKKKSVKALLTLIALIPIAPIIYLLYKKSK